MRSYRRFHDGRRTIEKFPFETTLSDRDFFRAFKDAGIRIDDSSAGAKAGARTSPIVAKKNTDPGGPGIGIGIGERHSIVLPKLDR